MTRHNGKNERFASFPFPSSFIGRAVGLAVIVLAGAQCGRGKLDAVGPGPDDVPGTGGSNGGIIPGSGGAGGEGEQCAAEDDPGFVSIKGFGTSLVVPNQTTAATPPPPISGGTLIALRDGITVVASDPDRDQIYVVDISDVDVPQLRSTIALSAHDEPGRLVEDLAGKVHVVLRNSASLVTIDPATGSVALRRAVCMLPRGVAYDSATDRLHVACANGQLSTFTPTGTTPERTLTLEQDLRDVVVDGDKLLVSRFRSAEVLVVDASGSVRTRVRPPVFRNMQVREGDDFEPSVAWRMVHKPGGGAAMVHQRGKRGRVDRRPGGYGSPGGGCDGIVHTAVSVVKSEGAAPAGSPAMPAFVLPVDLALSEDGRIAMVAAGNGHMNGGAQRLFVANVDEVTAEWGSGCGNDGHHGPNGRSCGTAGRSGGTGGRGGAGGRVGADGGVPPAADSGAGGTGGTSPGITTVANCNDLPADVEPTAVAFVDVNTLVVQSREPARLWVFRIDAGNLTGPVSLPLTDASRGDLGHTVFHSNSGGGLACASCHPEGHEDGRVWNFACEGDRRTQDIGGGLANTEPFHWNGDLGNFAALVNTVFVGRMSGPQLSTEQSAATMHWIDSIAALPSQRKADDAQVLRGRAVFTDPAVGCASCHNGSLLTNNTTVNVGTINSGAPAAFQVPALRGLAWRAPYMHNGCAATLEDRFAPGACGGGDFHGRTSQLTAAQRADLIAYLQSL